MDYLNKRAPTFGTLSEFVDSYLHVEVDDDQQSRTVRAYESEDDEEIED